MRKEADMRGSSAVAMLCGVAVVFAFALGVSAEEIKWAKSFDEAYKAAAQENKPVMIDIYTDWCGWCKKLDRDVYTAKAVVELSGKFICLKLNPETDQEHGALFKVDGFPTIIFTDAKKKELHRISGYVPPESFVEEMKKALKAFGGDK